MDTAEKASRKEYLNMKRVFALILGILMMVSVAFAEDALTAPEHMSGGWIDCDS